MSTFTNVLQQRINALENQIRNLQEQNNNLRRRARYLLESAPSTDMLMVPTADTQTPSEGPLGQYGGPSPDRYKAYDGSIPPGYGNPIPGSNVRFRGVTIGEIMNEGSCSNGVCILTRGVHTYVYREGPPASAEYYKNGEFERGYEWYQRPNGHWGWRPLPQE
jgi:hypothetical protein